jgi:hypothetical protein
VFAGGGRKHTLLPYEVTENNRSQQVASCKKTITERPMFRSVASFVTLVRSSFSFAFQENAG